MEKLNQDLFNDTQLETNKNRSAGICATSIGGGGTFCRTGTPPFADISLDPGF